MDLSLFCTPHPTMILYSGWDHLPLLAISRVPEGLEALNLSRSNMSASSHVMDKADIHLPPFTKVSLPLLSSLCVIPADITTLTSRFYRTYWKKERRTAFRWETPVSSSFFCYEVETNIPQPLSFPAPVYPSSECVICLDGTPEVIYYPCGHLCVHKDCDKGNICPLCRSPISSRSFSCPRNLFP